MLSGITPRLHGLLSLALLLAMANIIYLAVHRPAKSHLAYLDERLDSITFQLSRYRQLVDTRERLESELKQLKSRAGHTENYINASSSTLAIAEFQNQLKSLVEQHNGNIVSIHPQPVQAEQSFEKLMIRLQFGSDIKSLQKILHAMATHQPAFFINELVIQGRSTRSAPDDSLDTRMVITAYTSETDST